jgi:hypothetical protein
VFNNLCDRRCREQSVINSFSFGKRPPLFLLAAALSLVICTVSPLRAETHSCGPPILGCGKAQAMAARLIEEEGVTGDPQTREVLGDTDVLNYALDIEISNINTTSRNCTITGTNVMTIQSLSPALTQFTFRLRTQYAISSATVTDSVGSYSTAVTTVSTTTRRITLTRPIADTDPPFTVTIAYTGTSVSAGFGSIDVGTQGGTAVVATLSEAYYAYTWWPCKDGDVAQPGDNSDKATLQFNITVPNNFVVPSNGAEVVPFDSLSGNRRRYHWATDYPIATYLVSFAATNYNTWSQTYNFPAGPYNPAGSMPVQFFIYPGNDTGGNRAAWENCLNMLATYRPIFGEYPFVNEKYGIYNFNFGGGMEHQTMTGQGTFTEYVTAHELAHQWWGDNVTCETWSDIWLNEGFASYSECLWFERKAGGIDSSAYFDWLDERRPSSDGAGDSVYVYPSAITSGGMGRIFSGTYSYDKGCWVLHMLRHVVGDATFFDILDAYRQQFQGSAATTDEFAGVAATVSGMNLTPFFEQWVKQRGAPTYQYGWQSVNVAGQEYLLVRIAQTQTATTGSPPQVLSVYEMPVDLKATIGAPQVLVAQNNARTQWFVIPVSGLVTALTFDNNDLDGAPIPTPYILRGAATSVAYQPGPPKIVGTSPMPGDSVPQVLAPSQLRVTFHTSVNAATANFTLIGDTIGAQSLTLASGSNVNPAVLDLSGPLPPDDYTLTVTSPGLTAVNSGMALDGEIADPVSPASLPSGNGVAGGDATIRFTVQPCAIAADLDQNCVRDDIDITIFVDVLLGMDTDPEHMQRSDLDNSGTPDGNDIAPFTSAYLAP